MKLITDTEVATFCGVAVDANLTRIVNAVQADFRRATGRTFERKERTVYLGGFGKHVDYIFLPEAPIWSVAEVRIDVSGDLAADTAIDDLTVFAFRGSADEEDFRLVYLSSGYFPEGPRTVMVRFTAGYYGIDAAETPKPPEDLRDALIEEAVARYRRGASEQFQSESLSGVESFTRGKLGTTPHFDRAVRRYRRP